MRNNTFGSVVLGLGAVMLAASVASAQGIRVAKDANTGVTPRSGNTTMQGPGTGSNMMTSGGDVAMVKSWNDANITAHLILGDSLEIAMSRLAVQRASNASVRDFAQMMITDHGNVMQTMKREMVDEQWGFEPHPQDMGARHLMQAMTELRGLTGAAFDRAYMRHQVMHHAMHMRMSEPLADQAKDNDLEQEIEKMRPVFQRHHERARELARTVGVTDAQMMGGSGMNHNGMNHEGMNHNNSSTTTRPPQR